ncbi:hypothetical protein [Actinomadura oligospora]|uniref:hypothetical protein n=1 Tax=Actinomadura oligospora TaxID=111804 RepID=UPI00047A0427|nr:hypothetical protein [Actinomadura oligospora]
MPENNDNLSAAKNAQELLESYGETSDALPLRQLPGEGEVSDLLTDLMHYCSLQGVDFDHALESARLTFADERAEEGRFTPGACVELVGKAAEQAQRSALPGRGVVTGISDAKDGQPVYQVRSPGDVRARSYLETELRSAPQFGPVETTEGDVRSPLDAEQAVIGSCVQMLQAEGRGQHPHPDDVGNLNALFNALVDWTQLSSDRLDTLLAPKVESAYRVLIKPGAASAWQNPAQLAAADRGDPNPDLTAPPKPMPAPGQPPTRQSRSGPHR